jgi:DegV family protein with EDD domain
MAADLGVAVIPCQVHIGDESYRDGVDLRPDWFYSRMAHSSELPRTSQPPIRDFVDAYRRMAEEDADIVSIHVASSLSGTVNAAWAAADMLPDPSRVEVVDSGQLSMGLGWAVVEAARIARNGATKGQVVQSVQALLPRLRTVAMIDTLENLHKGGRINHITAVLGRALRIKPLLSIQGGQVSVVGQVRTQPRALKRLAALVRDWGPPLQLAVMHTSAEALAKSLLGLLAVPLPAEHVMLEPAGAALATHLGLGVVGVCAVLPPDS